MAAIRGKDTKPEMLVRSWLHRNGFRFRLHRKDLPGKPDIVLAKHRTVIFVHGCFWHRHGCSNSTMPSVRHAFWEQKLTANVMRDRRNQRALKGQAWTVIVLWECALRNRFESATKRVLGLLTRPPSA